MYVSGIKAQKILQRYPTPTSLMDMYNDLKKSEDEKAELLQNMFGPNRESKLSKLLYYFFNDKSEYQIAGASRADTKQNEVWGDSENVPQESSARLQGTNAKGSSKRLCVYNKKHKWRLWKASQMD